MSPAPSYQAFSPVFALFGGICYQIWLPDIYGYQLGP